MKKILQTQRKMSKFAVSSILMPTVMHKICLSVSHHDFINLTLTPLIEIAFELLYIQIPSTLTPSRPPQRSSSALSIGGGGARFAPHKRRSCEYSNKGNTSNFSEKPKIIQETGVFVLSSASRRCVVHSKVWQSERDRESDLESTESFGRRTWLLLLLLLLAIGELRFCLKLRLTHSSHLKSNLDSSQIF